MQGQPAVAVRVRKHPSHLSIVTLQSAAWIPVLAFLWASRVVGPGESHIWGSVLCSSPSVGGSVPTRPVSWRPKSSRLTGPSTRFRKIQADSYIPATCPLHLPGSSRALREGSRTRRAGLHDQTRSTSKARVFDFGDCGPLQQIRPQKLSPDRPRYRLCLVRRAPPRIRGDVRRSAWSAWLACTSPRQSSASTPGCFPSASRCV